MIKCVNIRANHWICQEVEFNNAAEVLEMEMEVEHNMEAVMYVADEEHLEEVATTHEMTYALDIDTVEEEDCDD